MFGRKIICKKYWTFYFLKFFKISWEIQEIVLSSNHFKEDEQVGLAGNVLDEKQSFINFKDISFKNNSNCLENSSNKIEFKNSYEHLKINRGILARIFFSIYNKAI